MSLTSSVGKARRSRISQKTCHIAIIFGCLRDYGLEDTISDEEVGLATLIILSRLAISHNCLTGYLINIDEQTYCRCDISQ